MMKHEFEQRIGALSVTNEDYEKIKVVYAFYPGLSEVKGKDQIAELFKMLGMRIIEDMLPRAIKAQELEDAIFQSQSLVNNLKDDLSKL